jgi:uncharacterized protein (UPF0332 family)
MTEEQEGLIAKAKESVRAAKILCGESSFDFAISRAYYAMFYVAQAFLLSRGLSYSSHASTIGAFGQNFARTGLVPIKFHRYLIDAQDKRSKGDYDILPSFNAMDADDQILIAEQFIEFAVTDL